jgi:glycosyltransferase involved in cell wall biosynthesis
MPPEAERTGVLSAGLRIEGEGNTCVVPRKPRLLIVVTLAETGGAQTYAAHLAHGLADRFEVTVAAHGDGPLRQAAVHAGARFVSLRQVRRPVNVWRDVLGLAELVRLCLRLRPEIVHANSSKAGLLALAAARLTGVRGRVFTAHGWAHRWYPGRAGALYLTAERLTGRLASRIVCVSESELRAGIAARTCRRPETIVIPNAVDVTAFPRAAHTSEVPRVLSVTRLAPPKDAGTLLGSLARLDGIPFRAQLVGDGRDRADVERELERLGLDGRVELLGERDDVPELLAGSDVFVLSSRSEGMPLAILEAMAAGLPVVASDVGGIGELVVDGESGLLVRPGDSDALAAALERVCADGALRKRMGAAARARAEELFDLPRFLGAHEALYERELRASRSASPFGRLSR